MPADRHSSVEVTTSARLHLGFLDLNGSLGRHFGSIGMLLDGPVTRLKMRRDVAGQVHGPERERAAQMLSALVAGFGLERLPSVEIAATMPAHAGLGSGTQLALALGAALHDLEGIAPNPREDARLTARGRRSGVGIALFEHGGLVVDGGRGEGDQPPPLLARLAIPEDWRILLLLDPAYQGLSGAVERDAFARLPPMPESVTGEICRLVLLQVLPAVAEADLPRFAGAITGVQERLGDHFAPAQGGRFTSPRVTQALATLRRLGSPGIGQSSWGPTGFAFASDEAEAERLRAALLVEGGAEGLDIQVRRPLNRGASIQRGP